MTSSSPSYWAGNSCVATGTTAATSGAGPGCALRSASTCGSSGYCTSVIEELHVGRTSNQPFDHCYIPLENWARMVILCANFVFYSFLASLLAYICMFSPLSFTISGGSTPIFFQSNSWSQKHGGFLSNLTSSYAISMATSKGSNR